MENLPNRSKNSSESYRRAFIQYSITLNDYQLNQYFVLLLIALQAIQLISMSVISPLPLKSLGLDYFQYAASIFYPDSYLRSSSLILYTIPLTSLLTLLHLTLTLYTFHNPSRLKLPTHYLFILFNTVLTVPYLTFNISVLQCTADGPFSHCFVCYEGFHVMYLVLACGNLVWVIFCTGFVFALYGDLDPLAGHYFAGSESLWVLAKFVVKLAPVIYVNVDPQLKFGVLYSVSVAGINLVYFGAFLILWPYHRNNLTIKNFQIRTEITTIFVCSFLIPLHFFTDDPQNIIFLLSWLLGLLVSQLVVAVLDYKRSMLARIFMDEGSQEEEIGEEEFIQFFYGFVWEIQRDKAGKGTPVMHLFKLHQVGCEDEECYCRVLAQIYKRQKTASQVEGSAQSQPSANNPKYTTEITYTFLCQLLKHSLTKSKTNTTLKIALAYLSYHKLSQKLKSIYKLAPLLKNSKITLAEEVAIRRLFYLLANDGYFVDQGMMDYRRYLGFVDGVWGFEREVERAAGDCRRYWGYLMEQNCEVTKVWRLANVVQQDKQKLDKLVHNNLLSIFPNNIHTLQLYTQLLTYLYRSPAPKLQPYIQTLSTAVPLPSSENPPQFHFRSNDHLSVMCAIEQEGIFQYVRVSSNIVGVLGVRNYELIGKNVSCVMLEVYQEFHDGRVRGYFGGQGQGVGVGGRDGGRDRGRMGLVYVVDKMGRVVQCYYQCKIVPSLVTGIELVCFIKKVRDQKEEPDRNKYLVYYQRKPQEDEQNSESPTPAEIIHIDPQLKKILYTETESSSNEISPSNLQQLLPQWDADNQEMIESLSQIGTTKSQGPHTRFRGRKIESIELVHSDKLTQGTVKYLKIQLTCNKPRITIDPVDSVHFLAEKKKRNEGSLMKESFWSQKSQSRLNLNLLQDDPSKKYQTGPTTIHPNSIPFPIPKLAISLASLASVALLIFLSVLPYKLPPSYSQIEQEQFHILDQVYNLNKNIYRTLVWVQLNGDGQGNGTVLADVGVLDRIHGEIRDIYELEGIDYVDGLISVPIDIYRNGLLAQTVSNTLNNALSFFSTLLANIFQGQYNNDQKKNLYSNIESFYHASTQLQAITSSLEQSRIAAIKRRQMVFESVQLVFLFLVTVGLVYRIVRVSNFCKSVFQIYENTLEMGQLKEFIRKCNGVVEKVHGGGLGQDMDYSHKKEKTKASVRYFEYFAPICKRIINSQAQEGEKRDKELDKEEEEEEKLMEQRKKLTFQSRPSKFKYIAMAFLILLSWIGVKSALKMESYFKKTEATRVENRNKISNLYEVGSKIERLIFYLALNKSQNIPYTPYLSQLESSLSQITSYPNTKTSINFQSLFTVLTTLKSSTHPLSDPQFIQIESSLLASEAEIIDYTLVWVRELAALAQGKRSVQILAGEIVIGVFAVFLYWRLGGVQEDIRGGCELMLDMVREGFGRSEDGQKSAIASPLPSMII